MPHEKTRCGNLLIDFYDRLSAVIAHIVPDPSPVADPVRFSPGFALPDLDDGLRDYLAVAGARWVPLGEYAGHPFTMLDLTANPGTQTTKTYASLLIVARAVEHIRRTGRLAGPLFATVDADGEVQRLGDVRKTLARVAEQIGFDETRGNTLIVERGKLAGTVADPIFGREGKLATLIELRDRLGLAEDETMAIGDGANDLDMLEAAGLAIAFNAKPLVREAADTAVNVPYLDTILFLLGISRDEVDAMAEEAAET